MKSENLDWIEGDITCAKNSDNTITLKCSLFDKVFILDKNQIIKAEIIGLKVCKGIEIEDVTIDHGNKNFVVKYLLKSIFQPKNILGYYNEENVFSSKEELIKYINERL
jgi:hypothetical protein